MRKFPLSRCRCCSVDLYRGRSICQYSHRSSRVFDVGYYFAFLQRINLLVPGDSRRVHRSDVHGGKGAPSFQNRTNNKFGPNEAAMISGIEILSEPKAVSMADEWF